MARLCMLHKSDWGELYTEAFRFMIFDCILLPFKIVVKYSSVCLHIHVCTTRVQYPQRPEEDTGSSESRATDDWILRTKPRPSARSISALHPEPSLQSLNTS